MGAQADASGLIDKRSGKWLLVLNNAKNVAVFPSLPSTRDKQSFSRYLPTSKHGAVIVTSRSARTLSRLVEDQAMLYLGPMYEADTQALLRKELSSNVNIGRMAS